MHRFKIELCLCYFDNNSQPDQRATPQRSNRLSSEKTALTTNAIVTHMDTVVPKKLSKNSTLQVVAPARSLAIISEDTRHYADKHFDELLSINRTFGEHTEEIDQFDSSSIESRVSDLHAAYLNPDVDGLITVIGGYNSNQLFDSLDWDIIANNPKILCGFSDITALQNAIYAKTGVVTYSGPHYSNFGQKQFDPYTADYFKKCVFDDKPYEVLPSKYWTDDQWFLNQDDRNPVKNEGYWALSDGEGEGTIIGGNLCTLNLLQGTEYMPTADKVFLFVEDDADTYAELFDRDLESLIQSFTPGSIQAVVIGRFQKQSEMTREKLIEVIKNKKRLAGIPIIANADFGHTDPKITFPLGGTAKLTVKGKSVSLSIILH